jgi:hypothetical protein
LSLPEKMSLKKKFFFQIFFKVWEISSSCDWDIPSRDSGNRKQARIWGFSLYVYFWWILKTGRQTEGSKAPCGGRVERPNLIFFFFFF